MAILYTSLNEIYSFGPCRLGWETILKGQNKVICDDMQFSLVDCLKTNSVSDVCWLLGKRKKEISICVQFANMCADSVSHLNTKFAAYAAAAAAAAAAANATYAAANAAAYEKEKNNQKQFLIQCIQAYESQN